VIAAEKKEIEEQFAGKKKAWEAATTERRGIAEENSRGSAGLYDTDRQKASGTALAQVRDGQCKALRIAGTAAYGATFGIGH